MLGSVEAKAGGKSDLEIFQSMMVNSRLEIGIIAAGYKTEMIDPMD